MNFKLMTDDKELDRTLMFCDLCHGCQLEYTTANF